ncbi:MAG: hypothetical protein LC751_10820 [Actinobacteria bacterium]|nr:hypothetical protein [Actinomycetota bacterium]
MAESNLVRWGGLAAIGAGVLFVLYFLLGLATGKGDESGALDILPLAGYVLEVVGLLGFHALQGRNYGRIGQAGLYTTIASIVLWEFLILASLLGGDVDLGGLVAVGVLGTLVGLVLYGAATLQARVLPRWCGILFILLMPGTILFGAFISGEVLWGGLVWVALGYALWSHSSSAATQRPSRVR